MPRHLASTAAPVFGIVRDMFFCRIAFRCAGCCLVALATLFPVGCTSPQGSFWQSLKGDGFTGWSDGLTSGVRDSKSAKPSGFFTDRRSEQIEQSLGGNF
jgi:hypothetical protein